MKKLFKQDYRFAYPPTESKLELMAANEGVVLADKPIGFQIVFIDFSANKMDELIEYIKEVSSEDVSLDKYSQVKIIGMLQIRDAFLLCDC